MQVTRLLLEERDSRRIEMFMQQYIQDTAELRQKNSPDFEAKRHQHSEGDSSERSTHQEPFLTLGKWGLNAREKHNGMGGDCKPQGFLTG